MIIINSIVNQYVDNIVVQARPTYKYTHRGGVGVGLDEGGGVRLAFMYLCLQVESQEIFQYQVFCRTFRNCFSIYSSNGHFNRFIISL